jgi:predicted dehydrogenase
LGERGIARVDAFNQNLAVYSDRTGQGEWVHWGSNTDLGLIQDFVDMIATGREPFITGYDGLKALEVALAAYRSAEQGEPVSLPSNKPLDRLRAGPLEGKGGGA